MRNLQVEGTACLPWPPMRSRSQAARKPLRRGTREEQGEAAKTFGPSCGVAHALERDAGQSLKLQASCSAKFLSVTMMMETLCFLGLRMDSDVIEQGHTGSGGTSERAG